MCKVDEDDYLNLNNLIHLGIIYYEPKENQWIGKASDRKWVGLGTTKDQVAELLHEHPMPKDW